MKKLLYTFFFGYLELKWRRLVRTLLLAYIILATLYLFDSLRLLFGDWDMYWDMYDNILRTTFILIILTPLVSYILKPFVVKED